MLMGKQLRLQGSVVSIGLCLALREVGFVGCHECSKSVKTNSVELHSGEENDVLKSDQWDCMSALDRVMYYDELALEMLSGDRYQPKADTYPSSRVLIAEYLRRRVTRLKPIASLRDDDASFDSLARTFLRCPKKQFPRFYKCSPALRCAESVERALGLRRMQLTSNDARVVGSHGATEGELIDALATRLREKFKSAGFKHADREWRESLRLTIKRCFDFLAEMGECSSRVSVIRIDHYLPTSIGVGWLEGLMSALPDAFERGSLECGLCGAIVRVDFIDSLGWRIHVAYFIDGDEKAFVESVEPFWADLTDGMGWASTCLSGLRGEGCGPLGEVGKRLKKSLAVMLSRDEVKRLNVLGIEDPQFFKTSRLKTAASAVGTAPSRGAE